jgi:UDP-3-O-[3-hydroxymyristoyl] glucosamine N-acyltransferase
MKLAELANKLDARLIGPGDIEIHGVAAIDDARGSDISYLSDTRHLRDAENCRAAAVIVPENLAASGLRMPLLAVKNPRYAFARALAVLHGSPYVPGGLSERAEIASSAMIGREATIHPFAVVAEGAKIGDRVTLYPGVYVGKGSVVGDDAVIYPNVSIREGVVIGSRVIIHGGAVVGSDGFGFVTDGGVHHKIPQVGGVIVEDDVEIGANCAIDRATLGNTVIKQGTKIDNLVHIAHNVTVGEHCLLAGQVGIAGSTTLGNYVVLGGKAGAADHITIGDRVMAGGGSAITRDVEPGQIIAGHNAMPLREWLKVQAVLPRLPEIKKRIAEIERLLRGKSEAKSSQEGEGR